MKGEVVQPAAVAGTVVTQPGSGVPPGCAPGGHWTTDKYCGIFSWILGVLCCWCVVCCPCDSRQVYNAPDGKKVLASGTPSGQFVAAWKSTATSRRWRRRAPKIYPKQVRRDVLTRSSLDVTVVSNAVDPSKVDKLT